MGSHGTSKNSLPASVGDGIWEGFLEEVTS